MSVTPRTGLRWRIVDVSHEVDYRQFALVEDGSEGPDLDDEDPQEPEWLTSGEGWIALLSGGSGHYPTIALETWKGEPPAEPQPWDEQRELEVSFSEDAEPLRIWGTASGPSSGPSFVLLPSDSGQYIVRVSRRSDTRAGSVAEQVVDLVDNDEYENGIFGLEEWLFQFWPRS